MEMFPPKEDELVVVDSRQQSMLRTTLGLHY